MRTTEMLESLMDVLYGMLAKNLDLAPCPDESDMYNLGYQLKAEVDPNTIRNLIEELKEKWVELKDSEFTLSTEEF